MFVLNSKSDPLLALLCLACTRDSTAHFLALAGIYDLLGINGIFVNLLFQNLSVFADQEVDAARGFVLVNVDAVLAGWISPPLAPKRGGEAQLIADAVFFAQAVPTRP